MYIPSSVIVLFNQISDETIENMLADNSLAGTRVSPILKRYAVDVPVGREETYMKLLRASDLVQHVCSQFIPGYKPKPRPKKPEDKK